MSLQSDLDFLSNPAPDAPSPYRGVYPGKGGKWEARAFQRKLSGHHPTPREAAKAVVAWWRGRYGERWRRVWAYKQTPGWFTVAAAGGVWAVAELAGDADVVIGVGPDGRAGEAARVRGCRPFRDRAEAARGVSAWAAGQWGSEARYRVRRVWCPTVHSHGRVNPLPAGA